MPGYPLESASLSHGLDYLSCWWMHSPLPPLVWIHIYTTWWRHVWFIIIFFWPKFAAHRQNLHQPGRHFLSSITCWSEEQQPSPLLGYVQIGIGKRFVGWGSFWDIFLDVASSFRQGFVRITFRLSAILPMKISCCRALRLLSKYGIFLLSRIFQRRQDMMLVDICTWTFFWCQWYSAHITALDLSFMTMSGRKALLCHRDATECAIQELDSFPSTQLIGAY